MRKIISLLLLFCFLNSFVFPSGTLLFAEDKVKKEKTLEEILAELEGEKKEVVKKEEIKEEKPIIAVADFTAGEGVTKGQASLITKFVEEEIFNTEKFKLVERSAMETILKEVGFQQTGCTETECAVEMGKMLNAEKIIVGIVSKQKKLYYLNIRLIDIEKAEIENIKAAEVKDEKDFKNACKKAISEMFKVKIIEKKPKKKKKNFTTYILGILLIGAIAGGLGGGGGGEEGGGGVTTPTSEPVPPMPPD